MLKVNDRIKFKTEGSRLDGRTGTVKSLGPKRDEITITLDEPFGDFREWITYVGRIEKLIEES